MEFRNLMGDVIDGKFYPWMSQFPVFEISCEIPDLPNPVFGHVVYGGEDNDKLTGPVIEIRRLGSGRSWEEIKKSLDSLCRSEE